MQTSRTILTNSRQESVTLHNDSKHVVENKVKTLKLFALEEAEPAY